MKRERDWNNCCGKNTRYREASTGEIKSKAGQEEASNPLKIYATEISVTVLNIGKQGFFVWVCVGTAYLEMKMMKV